MKIKTKITLLLLTLIVTSCAFNKQFFQPTQFSENITTINLNTETDTVKISINPKTYQPTFLKQNGDTLDLDFTIESVVFESSSGNKLNGWILKPENKNHFNITLLHLHGNGGSLYSQYQRMIPLLKYGFQIFLFDYSGYGYSEGKATRENVIKDAISAVNYVKNKKDFKNTKIVIYGQSLGANLGAVIAPKIEDKIDGLVLEGAFSNYNDIAAEVAGFVGRILVSQKNNALKTIQNYDKPLLVIHSTEDKTIPYELGKKLYDAANEPKEMFTIEKCHICGPEYYGEKISEKIKKMVE